jgi:hypothetical protein
MEDTKSIFLSRTFWGVVLAVLMPLLRKFGLEFDDRATQDLVEAITVAVGGLLAIYGRVKASRKATVSIPAPPPPPSISGGLALFMVGVLVLGLAGCDDSNYRKAVRATAGVASGLSGLQQSVEVAFDGGLVDPEEAKALALAIKDATLVNDQIIAQLRAVKSLDAGSAGSLVVYGKQLSASAEALYAQGILKVKNPQARQRFEATFLALKGSLQLLEVIVAELEAKQ